VGKKNQEIIPAKSRSQNVASANAESATTAFDTALGMLQNSIFGSGADGTNNKKVKIEIKDGVTKVQTVDLNGVTKTFTKFSDENIREFSSSVSNKTTKEKRKETAISLKKQGYTQDEIADRLGVSQKTISNDLADPKKTPTKK